VYSCHRESCWSNLVLILIWFISCQLVKAGRHVEFNWATACCLEASNPAVAFSHFIWNRNLMAVNSWLKCPPGSASVSREAGTHFGHFVPRRSRNWLSVVTFFTMKIKRYLLLISYWYWMYIVDVKIYRWFSTFNQFAKSFNPDLEVPVHCRNGVPRVSRCLFLGVRLIPSTAKSNYFDQMSCKSTTDLVNMTRV
jgi:hypothetical protein